MTEEKNKEKEYLERLHTTSQTKAFLGGEFLIWIWYQSETQKKDRIVDINSVGKIHYNFWIDDRIILESTGSETHSNTLKGGVPSQSVEATAALKSGKSVKEIKLGITVREAGDFSTVLNSQDLTPKSIKLPDIKKESQVEDEDMESALLSHRLIQTEMIVSILDQLFSEFLRIRMDKSWETKDSHTIREWIKNRH